MKSSDYDNAVYEDIDVSKKQIGKCYENPKKSSKTAANSEVVISPLKKTPRSNMKCVIALAVTVVVLLLGLAAACTGFVLSLRQAASMQQNLNIISGRLDNITLQMNTTTSIQQLMIQDYYALEHNSSRATSEQLENLAAQMNISIDLLYQQFLHAFNMQLENSSNSTAEKLENLLQQINASFNQQYSVTQQTNILLYQQFIQQRTSIQQLQDSSNTAHQRLNEIDVALNNTVIRALLGLYPDLPAPSCDALPPSSPPGYYYIRSSTGSVVYTSCIPTCGRGTRVAHLNMTINSHQCPNGLREHYYSNKRTCVRHSDSGCSSVVFSTSSYRYTSVCGRVKAYPVWLT